MDQWFNKKIICLTSKSICIALLVSMIGCLQTTSNRKPNGIAHVDPSKPTANSQLLVVNDGKAIPVLIGKHQSLNLNIELNSYADYARYEIYKEGQNKLLKNGYVYLGPVLIHDLPEGLMHIRIRACREKNNLQTTKDHCGKAYHIRYYQSLNTDEELVDFLKRREGLIDKQKDIGEQLVAAITEYRQAKNKNPDSKNKQFEDLLKPIEEAGAGKVGDLVAKSPGLEKDKEEDKLDSENAGDSKSDRTDGPLSFSNGVALLYIVGAGISKFGGGNKNPEKIKIEYKARMEALNSEMIATVEAKGDMEGAKAELKHLGIQVEDVKKTEPGNVTRLQNLLELKSRLDLDLNKAEVRYTNHNNRYQQLLAKDLTAAPSKVNIWVKRGGALTALVGAGLILFTSFDEGLLGKLDKFLDHMVFALVGEESSPEYRLRRSLDLIAKNYAELKGKVYESELLIFQHLKNANRN
ncbi:MAG: hypothetical protein AB8G05_18805 [Oligoflexales bacterium]